MEASDRRTPPKSFLGFLEHVSERVTCYVSSHWGTLSAFFLFVFGCAVFLRDKEANLATIVENLMTMLSLVLLFLLQRAQTKSTLSLQVKLNELLKAIQETDNRVINVEKLSEDELQELHDSYEEVKEGM